MQWSGPYQTSMWPVNNLLKPPSLRDQAWDGCQTLSLLLKISLSSSKQMDRIVPTARTSIEFLPFLMRKLFHGPCSRGGRSRDQSNKYGRERKYRRQPRAREENWYIELQETLSSKRLYFSEFDELASSSGFGYCKYLRFPPALPAATGWHRGGVFCTESALLPSGVDFHCGQASAMFIHDFWKRVVLTVADKCN